MQAETYIHCMHGVSYIMRGEQLTYTVQHDNLSSLSFIASKFSWYWDNNTHTFAGETSISRG